jgi:hypothetical protein
MPVSSSAGARSYAKAEATRRSTRLELLASAEVRSRASSPSSRAARGDSTLLLPPWRRREVAACGATSSHSSPSTLTSRASGVVGAICGALAARWILHRAGRRIRLTRLCKRPESAKRIRSREILKASASQPLGVTPSVRRLQGRRAVMCAASSCYLILTGCASRVVEPWGGPPTKLRAPPRSTGSLLHQQVDEDWERSPRWRRDVLRPTSARPRA